MDCPSGWVRKAGWAVRLKVGPVIPGAAAGAVGASDTIAAIRARISPVLTKRLFMLVGLIVALLVHDNFCHQSAEVLGVIRQMVKVWGVEVVRPRGNTRAIENHVERFAAGEGDGVGAVVQIVSPLVAEQLGVIADHLHWDSERS